MTDASPNSPHAPVLLAEVIEALAPAPGDVVIDATFGAGGYTRAILKTGAQVVALDRKRRWVALEQLAAALLQRAADAIGKPAVLQVGQVEGRIEPGAARIIADHPGHPGVQLRAVSELAERNTVAG